MILPSRCLASLAGALALTGLGAGVARADTPAAQVAVKVQYGTIEGLAATQRLVVDRPLIASRGVYLVHSADPRYGRRANELAKRLAALWTVAWAEADSATQLSDTRFHGWPYGEPDAAGSDPALWLDQRASRALRLDAAHALSRGAGTTVAVLDTGVDLSPAPYRSAPPARAAKEPPPRPVPPPPRRSATDREPPQGHVWTRRPSFGAGRGTYG
jgi:hypothetical protein